MVAIRTLFRLHPARIGAQIGHRQNAGTVSKRRSSQMSTQPTAQQGGSTTPAPQQQQGSTPQPQQQGGQPIFRDWASI
jgi:hypothetical protein